MKRREREGKTRAAEHQARCSEELVDASNNAARRVRESCARIVRAFKRCVRGLRVFGGMRVTSVREV